MTNRYVDCSERGLDIFYKVLGRYILLKISERFIKKYILINDMDEMTKLQGAFKDEPGMEVRLEILGSDDSNNEKEAQ